MLQAKLRRSLPQVVSIIDVMGMLFIKTRHRGFLHTWLWLLHDVGTAATPISAFCTYCGTLPNTSTSALTKSELHDFANVAGHTALTPADDNQ